MSERQGVLRIYKPASKLLNQLRLMVLNIMTSQIGDNAKKHYDLAKERDFWRIYLRLLSTVGVKLNTREEDVLSFILAGDVEVDYFSSPNSKQLKEVVGISNSEVTRLKQSLKARGLIDKQSNIPSTALVKLQKFVKKNPKIEFTFPLTIGA